MSEDPDWDEQLRYFKALDRKALRAQQRREDIVILCVTLMVIVAIGYVVMRYVR